MKLVAYHARQKFVRQRRQDTGSIPGVGLAAAGAPVIHVVEYLFGVHQNLVAASALNMGHEPYAARIVLERRVV
jgi:hypothetical protein